MLRKRTWIQKIRRFAYRWCDQLKQVEIWLLIISSIFISIWLTYTLVRSDFIDRLSDVMEMSDDRIAEMQSINLKLMHTLEAKVTPLVVQQEQVAEMQSDAASQIEQVSQEVKQAAKEVKGVKRGMQVNPQVKPKASPKVEMPSGGIRQTSPNRVNCFNGRDIYGDRCE